MARDAARSSGLYFKTPSHLLPDIARLLGVPPVVPAIEPDPTASEYWLKYGRAAIRPEITIVDPCAADGEAVCFLGESIKARGGDIAYFTNELEASRHTALKARLTEYKDQKRAVHGDVFCLEYVSDGGASVLFENPPYDAETKPRLETKFLARTLGMLADGGILLFLVPYKALEEVAPILARSFTEVRCFRFPDEDFPIYKQVLVCGVRSPDLQTPDAVILERVLGWAENPELCEPWSAIQDDLYALPVVSTYSSGFSTWEITPIDVVSLAAAARPWMKGTRSGGLEVIQGVVPSKSGIDLLTRRYPVAMPLKAAYIAAAVACGVFDGAPLVPNSPRSKLPNVLSKGVFERNFVTIEDKVNKDGDKTGEIQVQTPKLAITVLDMTRGTYHTLPASADRVSSTVLARMTAADFLDAYSVDLLRVMGVNCPVLYDSARDGDEPQLPSFKRPLYRAQANTVRAAVKLLSPKYVKERAAWDPEGAGKPLNVLGLGEVGSGKCLRVGTLVLRFDGVRVPVEDVRAGDLLMGPDSTPRKVRGTTRGHGPLFKVTPVVGESWVCNDAHVLTLVHTETGDVFDIEARAYADERKRLPMRLSRGGRTTHAKVDFKQFFPEKGVDFPTRSAPILDPYFLGVWYGDGTKAVHDNGNIRGVAITKPDTEIRDLVLAVAAEHDLDVRTQVNTSGCPTYVITSGRAYRRTNGVLLRLREEYGDGERLPSSCLLGSREVRLAFLAGLLDTDGHLSNNVYDIVQKRKGWADGICFIARSLGICATLSEKIVNGESYWRVCLSGELSVIPLRIPRKQAHPRVLTRGASVMDPSKPRNHRRVSRTGIRVEPIGDGEYAGFELDGDGRFLLGDFTVTHNSSLSLAIAHTLSKRSILVICPPHLVDLSWPNEVAAVFGDGAATAHPIRNIADLEAFAALRRQDGRNSKILRVAVLSRESAKLGHGYGSLDAPRATHETATLEERHNATPPCPRCGAIRPHSGGREYSVTRARCTNQRRVANNAAAVLCESLGTILHAGSTAEPVVQAFKTRPALLVRQGRKAPLVSWEQIRERRARELSGIAFALVELTAAHSIADSGIIALLAAINSPSLTLACAEELLAADREEGRELTLLLDEATRAELAERYPYKYVSTHNNPWADVMQTARCIVSGAQLPWAFSNWGRTDGVVTYCKLPIGSGGLAEHALRQLGAIGRWRFDAECGEPLYFATPDPSRFPVADWIVKRHKHLFDFIILDESHEYSDGDSAQTQASSKILRLGIPSICLTGSACGGYAESLFAGTHTRDARFRSIFDRDSSGQFVKVYGYVKQIVEDRKEGEIVEFGSNSDKVIRTARTIGNAPGVLPLFLLQWLLRGAITVHKGDFALDLPPHTERKIDLELSGELAERFDHLASKLRQQIKADRYVAGKAGKLWGALMELLAFPDMAIEGIGGEGAYEIRYAPETVPGAKKRKKGSDEKGDLVCSAPLFPASTILPKEKLMLEEIERALSSGSRFLLFARHVALLPRLAELVQRELGEPCPVLFASKAPGMRKGDRVVGAQERQSWIESEIIGRNRRVMAVNPTAVKTGLNVLTWFDRAWWHENPGCDATTDRQANGRIDRIGKKRPTEAIYPVYVGMQAKAFNLLKHKVAVSLAVDGLDAGSALAMAGIGGDGGFDAFSVGRQLFELMEKDG